MGAAHGILWEIGLHRELQTILALRRVHQAAAHSELVCPEDRAPRAIAAEHADRRVGVLVAAVDTRPAQGHNAFVIIYLLGLR